jgi:hypothetical protein
MNYTLEQQTEYEKRLANWTGGELPPDLQAYKMWAADPNNYDATAAGSADGASRREKLGITPGNMREVQQWLKTDSSAATNFASELQQQTDRNNAVRQRGVQTNFKNMNFGSALNSALLNGGGNAGAFAGGAVSATLGDALGGFVRGLDQNAAAAGAANTARMMQNAQNEHARNDIVAQGEGAAQDMNLAARGTSAQMTDNAIAQANSFESGMQGIGASGIEGSANMERNLQYGQSKADAQEQMQFDMMSDQANDLSDSMAHSFSDLSQMTQQAGTNALNGSINAADDAYNKAWREDGEYNQSVGVKSDERDQLYLDAEAAMNADPLKETAAPAYGWAERAAGLKGLSATQKGAGEAAYKGGQTTWNAWVKEMNAGLDPKDRIGNWMRK